MKKRELKQKDCDNKVQFMEDSGRHNRLSFSVFLTLLLPCIVTKFLICETNIRKSNVHRHKFLCLLLHVSAETPSLGSLYVNI